MPEPKRIEITINEGREMHHVEFWTYDYRIQREPVGHGVAPFSLITGPAYDIRMRRISDYMEVENQVTLSQAWAEGYEACQNTGHDAVNEPSNPYAGDH